MKKTIHSITARFLAMFFLGIGVLGLSNQTLAQNEIAPIDFEPEGNGADWEWVTFENVDNPPLEFIENPDTSGINTSETVAKFTARANGAAWAGARGTGGEPFLFDETNRTVTIMIWKSVISDVGIKLETASNWAQQEIKVANTKVNEWEEIVIDFTGRENPPGGEPFNGISVFPDYQANRGQDNVVYFDNIVFEGFSLTSGDDNGGNGDNGDNGDNDWIDGPDVVPVDFEPDGNGADWDWVTFENADNPPLAFVANPDTTGINTSETVARYTARSNGANWAGARGTGGSTFYFREGERTISIMVWKSVISDIGIKLETHSNWAQQEIRVANTKVNEWEEIAIDFTGRENPPNREPFNGISVFPDYQANRGQDNVVYFDNIVFDGFVSTSDNGEPTSIEEGFDSPTGFALAQNYPNPFNPTTQIEFALPETGFVRLDVYNMIGQQVATLVNETVSAGSHTVSFDAGALSSGIYLYRLQAGSTVLTKRMTLVK